MSWMQIIEIIAVILGLGNVYFLTRQKMIAWPLGIATVSIYTYIFYQSRLFSDCILHVIYIILNIYGWWNWTHGGARDQQLPVTKMSMKSIGIWTLILLVGFVIWGHFMDRFTTADFAYADAFTTVASLIAQFLMAKKKLENWLLWIIVDVVAIQIYFLKDLNWTAGLYFVYLLLCLFGYFSWRKDERKYAELSGVN